MKIVRVREVDRRQVMRHEKSDVPPFGVSPIRIQNRNAVRAMIRVAGTTRFAILLPRRICADLRSTSHKRARARFKRYLERPIVRVRISRAEPRARYEFGSYLTTAFSISFRRVAQSRGFRVPRVPVVHCARTAGQRYIILYRNGPVTRYAWVYICVCVCIRI